MPTRCPCATTRRAPRLPSRAWTAGGSRRTTVSGRLRRVVPQQLAGRGLRLIGRRQRVRSTTRSGTCASNCSRGDAAGPQEHRRRPRAVDDRGLDANRRGAAIENEVHAVHRDRRATCAAGSGWGERSGWRSAPRPGRRTLPSARGRPDARARARPPWSGPRSRRPERGLLLQDERERPGPERQASVRATGGMSRPRGPADRCARGARSTGPWRAAPWPRRGARRPPASSALAPESVHGLGRKRDQAAARDHGGGLGDHVGVGTLGVDGQDARHGVEPLSVSTPLPSTQIDHAPVAGHALFGALRLDGTVVGDPAGAIEPGDAEAAAARQSRRRSRRGPVGQRREHCSP